MYAVLSSRISQAWSLLFGISLVLGCWSLDVSYSATITVSTNRIGVTPSILAYNAGHFVPGSNTKDWWRYSGTIGVRLFITPSSIEPGDDIAGRGDGVTDSGSFVSRKNALRANPLNTTYINWPYFTNNLGATDQHGSNIINPNDTCSSLRQIGVNILICLTVSEGTFPITDTNDWAGKWELWQHCYAEAFYFARYFDVQRFQMYNEPNLASLTADEFLERLKIASDAFQSAVADVNTLYGKSLTPWTYTPVTAGTASSRYPDWGKMVVTNRHKDFLGNVSTNFWLLHRYDYHEYNSTPANFGANLSSLNNSLTADMSPEPRFPTSISEFNVHTAGTFDTLTDTGETPSIYTSLGSILVNLAKNSCDDFYLFKFSQTLNTTTVKKNGMHYVDNTNAPYNIGGVLKGGEVYRLFNQAAAPGRDRLNVTLGAGATKLDTTATFDPISKYYHLFSASYSNSSDLTLDLTAWNVPNNQRVLLSEVSEGIWGGAKTLGTVSNNQLVAGIQQTNTVWLFTLPTKAQESLQTMYATGDAMVQDGANKQVNYGPSNVCYVRNNSTNANLRSATLLKFHLPLYYHTDTQIALLALRASSINGTTNVQAHAYGLSNTNWSQGSVTWSNAPNLAQNMAAGSNYINNVVLGAGTSAQLVGQLVADNNSADRYIDVTKYLRGQPGFDVSFLLSRDVRFFGDAQNNDGIAITSSEGSASFGPRLLLVRLKDTDGDGLSDDAETNIFNTNPNLADTDHDGFTDGQEVLLYGTNPGSNGVVAPTINTQPASQSAYVGDTVNFSASASGTPPLVYQWYFNATNALPGATNASLTLANVQLYQAGAYNVIVTNSTGSAVSSNALLTVQIVPPPPLPAYDPLNYAPGTLLADQGQWVLNGGASGTIEAGNLFVNGLAASSGNRFTWYSPSMSVRLLLGTNLTSGQIYFSFAMRVDNPGSAMTSVGTLAGFASGTSTSFGTKINIRTNGGGGFNLGVSKSGGTTYGAWAANDFGVGETIFVVGRYTFNPASLDDTCDLWLNPPVSSFGATSPPPPNVAAVGPGGTDITPIDRFFFRSGGSSASPDKLVADEVRVGFTWGDVTPPAPVPLAIQQAGSSITLSWPTNSLMSTLQSAATLASPVWSNIAGSPSVAGTNYTFNLPPTNTTRFFRLAR
jgi:hypothetical protein